MKLGINAVLPHESPQQWAEDLAKRGFEASSFPVDYTASDALIHQYEEAAKSYGITIAEVGIWRSPFVTDEQQAKENQAACVHELELADMLHAGCCVNVSGAAGELWYAYYPENYSEEMYQRNVEFAQYLLDTVKPQNTWYTLELMPWMLPDSAEAYLQFIWDVNRERMAVHFDPVNLVNSVEKVRNYPSYMEHAMHLLHPYMKSCHIKDFILGDKFMPDIVEVVPGQGYVDIQHYLSLIRRVDPDMTVLFEHLKNWDEYEQAIAHVRKVIG